METKNEVEEELERQWYDYYLPEIEKLDNPSVEDPLDWYNRVGDKPLSDTLSEDAKKSLKQLEEMPLHVLYRVFPVFSQDIALVGHNPKNKTSELEPGSGELFELAGVDMNPSAISEITGPRIAGYYFDFIEHETALTDVVLEGLRETEYIDYGSLEGYFNKSKNENLPPIFQDIYITNLMKLPTDTGSGVTQFNSDFYRNALWEELSALSPEVVFVQGRETWEAVKKQGEEEVGLEPLNGAPDTSKIIDAHGNIYRIGNMNVIPLVHPSAFPGGSNKRYDKARDLLISSIEETKAK